MPTGTPYNSFIHPYRIRVDDFATPGSTEFAPAQLHLLTHTHSDHINGLSAKLFGYRVICSHDAKAMLLRHEVYAERELHELELRVEKTRTYSHLKIDPQTQPDGTIYYHGSRDLLKPLPLNTPTRIELSADEFVTITLFDANHCPGAVMFLIEGAHGAVLHTGDFRAEPWFVESLTHNPLLQPYLALPQAIQPVEGAKNPKPQISKTLEAIYLDTASLLTTMAVPGKNSAIKGLVELMKLFPEEIYFFINTWTWGYEDILKSISREFQCQIHVDRYKHSVYHHTSDPFLRLITTRDASSTRFHACERFHRCEYVAVDNTSEQPLANSTSHRGKHVVYINPVTMGTASWDLYLQDTKRRLNNSESINNLLVPLSRHSPLPELRAFVSLFRPHRIVPNTLDPRLHGLDWAAMRSMFAGCLSPHGKTLNVPVDGVEISLADAPDNEGDVALKNLVGNGAVDLAQRWAENAHFRKRLETVRGYLGTKEGEVVDRLLGLNSYRQTGFSGRHGLRGTKGKGKRVPSPHVDADSENETDNGYSDDERGKTAHRLFASLAGIGEEEHPWWSSSPSQVVDSNPTHSCIDNGGPLDSASKTPRVGSCVRPTGCLTPVSSPPRPAPLQKMTPRLPGGKIKERKGPLVGSPACIPPHPDRSLVGEPSGLASPIHIQQPRPSGPGHAPQRVGVLPIAPTSSISSSPPSAPVGSPLTELNKHLPGPAAAPPSPPCETNTAFARKRKPSPSSGTPRTETASWDENEARQLYGLEQPPLRKAGPQSSGTTSSSHGKPPSGCGAPGGRGPSVGGSHRTGRSQLCAQRLRIAERLARAWPDLVVPSYASKRARLLARHGPALGEPAHAPGTLLLSFETVDDGDGGMDWGRSRELAEALRADVAAGRRPMLPPLICAESQSQELES